LIILTPTQKLTKRDRLISYVKDFADAVREINADMRSGAESELDELRSEIIRLESEVEDLKSQNQDLESKIDELQSEAV